MRGTTMAPRRTTVRNPLRQRGWLRNPFPGAQRLIERVVRSALREFSSSRPALRRARFESLEPRILLSGDPVLDTTGETLEAINAALDAQPSSPVQILGLTPVGSAGAPPDGEELAALFSEAKLRMAYDGAVRMEMVDLTGPYLAWAGTDSILVDADATGYGWFVDPTPELDEEYAFDEGRQRWVARDGSPAEGRIDLLTVLMHELGHVNGVGHADSNGSFGDVMQPDLGAGIRRTLIAEDPAARMGGSFVEALVDPSGATDELGFALTITPTVTWTGTHGFWDDGANWSTGIAPGVDDDVLIDTAAAQHTITVRTNVTVRSLLVNENVVIQTSGQLNVAAEAEINGAVTLNGGMLGGSGAIVLTGALNVTAQSTLSGSGVLTTRGTSTVDMAGGQRLLALTGGKTWVNEGELTLGGDDYLYFGYFSGGTNTLTNATGATLNLSSTHATPLNRYTGTAVLTNEGTLNLTVSGSHAIDSGVAFHNSGTVNVDAGTLVIEGSGTDTGEYAVDAGATLDFRGGTRNLSAGTSVVGSGTWAVSGGTVNINDALEVSALELRGGTLSGAGELIVAESFSATGHSFLSGGGVFRTRGTSTIDLGGGATLLAVTGGKTWVNEGELTIGGDDYLYFGYTGGGTNTLTNAAGGTLNLSSTNAAPLNRYTGTAVLNNEGTLNLTVSGSRAIDNSIAFHNSGTVNIDAGTLSIEGGGTDSGQYAVAADATLDFGGGTRTLGVGTNVTGLGTLAVTGATLNVNSALDIGTTGAAVRVSSGTLSIDTAQTVATLVLSGGTLSGAGELIVAESFSATGHSFLSGGECSGPRRARADLGGGATLLAVSKGGKTWVNEGELTIGGDDYLYFGYTGGGTNTLTNAAGGTLESVEHECRAAEPLLGHGGAEQRGHAQSHGVGFARDRQQHRLPQQRYGEHRRGHAIDRRRGHRQRPVRGRCGCDAGLRRRHAHARGGDERHGSGNVGSHRCDAKRQQRSISAPPAARGAA